MKPYLIILGKKLYLGVIAVLIMTLPFNNNGQAQELGADKDFILTPECPFIRKKRWRLL